MEMCLINRLKETKLDWESLPENPYLFSLPKQNKEIRLRLNDFPDEPICTLIINGEETDLEEFPALWSLPEHRK
jgi:hypothetical protein